MINDLDTKKNSYHQVNVKYKSSVSYNLKVMASVNVLLKDVT